MASRGKKRKGDVLMSPAKKPRLAPAVSKAVNRQIRKQLNKAIESKHHDYLMNSSGVDFSGTMHDLSQVNGGNSSITRVGDKIQPSQLDLRWQVTIGDTTNSIRMILFQWHPDDATDLPTTTEILQTIAVPEAPQAQYNTNFRSQYRVLKDVTIPLGASSRETVTGRWLINKHMRPIHYNFGAVTGVDKIYLMVISDSGAVPNPGFIGRWRMYFKDA